MDSIRLVFENCHTHAAATIIRILGSTTDSEINNLIQTRDEQVDALFARICTEGGITGVITTMPFQSGRAEHLAKTFNGDADRIHSVLRRIASEHPALHVMDSGMRTMEDRPVREFAMDVFSL